MTVERAERVWRLVTVQVMRRAEEVAQAVFFELGATGTVTVEEQEERLKLGAYFDQSLAEETLAQQLEAGFAAAGARDALLGIAFAEIPDQDWMQKWKEGFEPTAVGKRLLIAPSWKLPADSEARLVIQIDPGQAFGTGTHETTRLCLEALETYWRGGSLLDVGTGTAILAIAAALLMPTSHITAIDIDPLAVEVAQENVAINFAGRQAAAVIEVCEGEAAAYLERDFDVVVANLTAEVIIAVKEDLARALKLGGVLILSGILTTLCDDVEAAMRDAGMAILERRAAGEWALLVAQKGGA